MADGRYQAVCRPSAYFFFGMKFKIEIKYSWLDPDMNLVKKTLEREVEADPNVDCEWLLKQDVEHGSKEELVKIYKAKYDTREDHLASNIRTALYKVFPRIKNRLFLVDCMTAEFPNGVKFRFFEGQHKVSSRKKEMSKWTL